MYKQYLDKDAWSQFENFLYKVNERTEFQYGLRAEYTPPPKDLALGPDVEYFSFLITADDRMRYIMENIVSLPDSILSQRNKICNTIISHFYGARGIHFFMTGYSDPKKANIDFERILVDEDYLNDIKLVANYNKNKGIKAYGTTELHTSIQTAGRNYCRKKYNNPTRPIEITDIVEWIASWIEEGYVDRILNVKSLLEMFDLLSEKPGIGNYYAYHCSTSNSVNPKLAYQHDENFCAPGPGACQSLDFLFPTYPGKKPYDKMVIWIRKQQRELFSQPIVVHDFFHNFNGAFADEQNELKVYGTEVILCQFSVYCRLKANPSLIKKRTIARIADDSVCDGSLLDELKTKKKKKNIIVF
jgi:hypothetical protein